MRSAACRRRDLELVTAAATRRRYCSTMYADLRGMPIAASSPARSITLSMMRC